MTSVSNVRQQASFSHAFSSLHDVIKNRKPLSTMSPLWLLSEVDRIQDGETPLTLAIKLRYYEEASDLLSVGADPLSPNLFGKTPLALAEASDEPSIVDLVKNAIAKQETHKRKREEEEVSTAEKRLKPALFEAAEKGNFAEVRSSIEQYKTDVNATNANGYTPLQIALFHGQLEIADYLIQKKADIHFRSKDGTTPLYAATLTGNLPLILKLVENGANLKEGIGPHQTTALHIAAAKGFTEIVEYLTMYIDVDVKTLGGSTPLYMAAMNGNLETIKKLVEKGANVQEENGLSQTTALHVAAAKGYVDVISYLIERQADVNAKTDHLSPPLFLAAMNGKLEAVKKLVERGANIHEKTEPLGTVLHAAARVDNSEIIEFLIEKGVKVDEKFSELTALFIASGQGKLNAVKKLLEKGAAIDETNTLLNVTALHSAASGNQWHVVEYLIRQKANIEARSKNHNTALFIAVCKDHLEAVEKLVEGGIDIDGKNEGNWTALHFAASTGHVRVLAYLVEKGADIRAETPKRDTPLDLAAGTGNVRALQILLRKRGNIDELNGSKMALLHIAARTGQVKVIEYLIQSGANIEAKTTEEYTPLFIAVFNGHLNAVKWLVEKQVKIEEKNGLTKWTALHLAAAGGHVEIIEYLTQMHAEIEAKTEDNLTPLYLAVLNNKLEGVKKLISQGALVNSKNTSNQVSPLHAAAKVANREIIQVLVENQAEIDMKSEDGKTPLYFAAADGKEVAVEELIERGAKIEEPNSNSNWTAMHAAADKNNAKCIASLVKKNGNINAKTKSLLTPLYIAAANGHTDAVEILLQNGAEIDQIHGEGEGTALHGAINNNRPQVVKCLLKSKANIEAKTADSLSPLGLAAEIGDLNMVKLLIENHANINGKSGSSERTPLQIAIMESAGPEDETEESPIQKNHKGIIKYLIQHGADVNLRNKRGATALYTVAEEGDLDLLNLLLDAKADLNQSTDTLDTPLHIAIVMGNMEIVRELLSRGADTSLRNKAGKTAQETASNQEIRSLFATVEFYRNHMKNLESFSQKLKTPEQWVVQDFFLVAYENMKLWDPKYNLAHRLFKAFTMASCDYMIPFFIRLRDDATLQKQFTDTTNEVIQKMRQASTLAEAKKFHDKLRTSYTYFTQLTPSLFGPHPAVVYNEAIKKFTDPLQAALLEKEKEEEACLAKNQRIEAQTEEVFREKFAERETFGLLTNLGIGMSIEMADVTLNPVQSYSIVADLDIKKILQYGFVEGRDFQAIGIDFILDYYHLQLTSQFENMEMRNYLAKVLQTKLSLVEAVGAQNKSHELPHSLATLQKELTDEKTEKKVLLNHIKECNKDLSLTLLRTFCSQKPEDVVPKLTRKPLHVILTQQEELARKALHQLKEGDQLEHQIALYYLAKK